MAKKPVREYNPGLDRILPKKQGQFSSDTPMTKSGMEYGFGVSRANDETDESYYKVLASNYPWLEDLDDNQVASYTDFSLKAGAGRLTGVELVKMGFEINNRFKDENEAEAERVLFARKYNQPAHIVIAGNTKNPLYELWVPRENTNTDKVGVGFGKSVASNMPGMTKVAAKRVKYNIPASVTKIAWDDAIKLGIVSNLEYVGFNKYQSSDRKGVWWKQRITDQETGEEREYLVREKDIEHATDIGNMKVEGVTKVAKKVMRKKASTETKEKRELDTETTKATEKGIGLKVVDLESGNWKSEVESYLSDIKKQKMKPKKLEVKVVDWDTEDI